MEKYWVQAAADTDGPQDSHGDLVMPKKRGSPSREGPADDDWKSDVSAGQVYAHLTEYYLYQDRLGWSRTQTLVVVEAALLAGSYALAGAPIAPIILLLGTLLVWSFWRLVKRDWEIRDQNLKLTLDKVHKPKGIEMVIAASSDWSRGQSIVTVVVYGLLALNIVLGVCYTLLACGIDNLSLRRIFGLN